MGGYLLILATAAFKRAFRLASVCMRIMFVIRIRSESVERSLFNFM